MSQYYNIPFNFRALLKRQNRESYCCSLQESIKQNITLIISTKINEFRFDPNYGCMLWEVDFIVPSDINLWKEEIKVALEEDILKYEFRIDEIIEFRINVNENTGELKRGTQVLDFSLIGSIKGTSKEFEYSDTLFFSPYSR